MRSRTPVLMALAFLAAAGCSSGSNKGTNPMPVTEPFESGDIPSGGTFVHTFPTAGSFIYRCRIHSTMSGTISVTAGAADSALVSIGPMSFGAAAPIRPGGYVRWQNGGVVHTVTRP